MLKIKKYLIVLSAFKIISFYGQSFNIELFKVDHSVDYHSVNYANKTITNERSRIAIDCYKEIIKKEKFFIPNKDEVEKLIFDHYLTIIDNNIKKHFAPDDPLSQFVKNITPYFKNKKLQDCVLSAHNKNIKTLTSSKKEFNVFMISLAQFQLIQTKSYEFCEIFQSGSICIANLYQYLYEEYVADNIISKLPIKNNIFQYDQRDVAVNMLWINKVKSKYILPDNYKRYNALTLEEETIDPITRLLDAAKYFNVNLYYDSKTIDNLEWALEDFNTKLLKKSDPFYRNIKLIDIRSLEILNQKCSSTLPKVLSKCLDNIFNSKNPVYHYFLIDLLKEITTYQSFEDSYKVSINTDFAIDPLAYEKIAFDLLSQYSRLNYNLDSFGMVLGFNKNSIFENSLQITCHTIKDDLLQLINASIMHYFIAIISRAESLHNLIYKNLKELVFYLDAKKNYNEQKAFYDFCNPVNESNFKARSKIRKDLINYNGELDLPIYEGFVLPSVSADESSELMQEFYKTMPRSETDKLLVLFKKDTDTK